MLISGFTYVRNALILDYPVVESICSVLPICDEFIVSCGDSVDETRQVIENIGSPKIKIIDTVWDIEKYPGGSIHAQQANIALKECKGKWAIYIQADEVIHEKYLPIILKAIEKYDNVSEVEGFLVSYKHFWGDYEHYQTAHNWYRREIRIIRNGIGIKVWGDGQGFRRNGRKVKVVLIPVEVYHYGWVRDPMKMKKKIIAQDEFHHTTEWVKQKHPPETHSNPFQYGTLKHLARFKDSHPAVMKMRIESKNWSVDESVKTNHKHNKILVRLLSFIENKILHTRIGEYKNYKLIKKDDFLTDDVGRRK